MHLMTALEMKQPGILFRGAILLAQGTSYYLFILYVNHFHSQFWIRYVMILWAYCRYKIVTVLIGSQEWSVQKFTQLAYNTFEQISKENKDFLIFIPSNEVYKYKNQKWRRWNNHYVNNSRYYQQEDAEGSFRRIESFPILKVGGLSLNVPYVKGPGSAYVQLY